MTAAITRAAEQVAESAILRYVRITTFHPTEETALLLAFADALVMLEDLGAEAVIEHARPAPSKPQRGRCAPCSAGAP